MPTYTVDMAQVQVIVEEMNSMTQRLQQTVTNLQNQAQSTLAEWTSEARELYNQVKAKWDAAIAEMTRLVQQAIASLSGINGNYGDGERRGVSMWAR